MSLPLSPPLIIHQMDVAHPVKHKWLSLKVPGYIQTLSKHLGELCVVSTALSPQPSSDWRVKHRSSASQSGCGSISGLCKHGFPAVPAKSCGHCKVKSPSANIFHSDLHKTSSFRPTLKNTASKNHYLAWHNPSCSQWIPTVKAIKYTNRILINIQLFHIMHIVVYWCRVFLAETSRINWAIQEATLALECLSLITSSADGSNKEKDS